jgi:hypothetical protein
MREYERTTVSCRNCRQTRADRAGEQMKDLAIELEDRPGALAEMGEALGRAGVSVEGGGAWVTGGVGVAHFLFSSCSG